MPKDRGGDQRHTGKREGAGLSGFLVVLEVLVGLLPEVFASLEPLLLGLVASRIEELEMRRGKRGIPQTRRTPVWC